MKKPANRTWRRGITAAEVHRVRHLLLTAAIMTLSLGGCAGKQAEIPTPQAAAVAQPTKKAPALFEDALPDRDLQNMLTKTTERSVAEEKAEDAHAAEEERRIRRALEQAHEAGDFAGEADRYLELGDSCRHYKQIHEALEHYRAAEDVARKITDDSNGRRAHALAMAGEMRMRLFKYDDALADFDKAQKLVREPNKLLESTTKMELRKVWPLHLKGKDADAKALLAKAKEQALREGKQSAAYHVALALEGGFAAERKDIQTVDKITSDFEALPEPTLADAEFGQNYMKACAKASRHAGFGEAEDYFEDKGSYFRAIIKQIRDEKRRSKRRHKH